ncbi:MAG: hypothetical protein JWR77_1635 [Rhizorhabdus sp.]|nr:hypothetical protein [Rhizorhabdus sp.]
MSTPISDAHVIVIPAKAGIQFRTSRSWIPAFAGMTAMGALLTACGSHGSAAIPGAEPIPCGTSTARIAPDCTIERDASPEGNVLTLRNPDGSFRRLLIVKDGRGVIAADGAEAARVSPAGPGNIDVAIGGMIYRLPARLTP